MQFLDLLRCESVFEVSAHEAYAGVLPLLRRVRWAFLPALWSLDSPPTLHVDGIGEVELQGEPIRRQDRLAYALGALRLGSAPEDTPYRGGFVGCEQHVIA